MSKPFKIVSLNVKTSWGCQPECQNLLGLSARVPKPFETVRLNVNTLWDCQPECQNLPGLLA